VFGLDAYDTDTFDKFGYSYGLALCAMVLSFTAGVCFLVSFCCNKPKR
jgi:hypothetical protein